MALLSNLIMCVHLSFLHCNQNDQEKLDHLPGYTFEKDDESKWGIDIKSAFIWTLGINNVCSIEIISWSKCLNKAVKCAKIL